METNSPKLISRVIQKQTKTQRKSEAWFRLCQTPRVNLNVSKNTQNPGLSKAWEQGLSIRVDGWSVGNRSMYNSKEWCPVDKKYSKARIRQVERLHEIGIVLGDGQIFWKKFDSFIDKIPLDFLRALGKGAGWRCVIRKEKMTKDTVTGERRKERVNAEWNNLPIDIQRTCVNALQHPKEVCRSMNESDGKLPAYVRCLSSKGWVIRKEDKGPRLCFVRKEWEELQAKIQLESVELPKKEVHEQGRIYFTVKTHKGDKVPVPGRPIVNFRDCYDIVRCKHISRQLHRFIGSKDWFDCDNTQKAVTKMTPVRKNSTMLIGDIENMFTNVPRDMVLEGLKESGFLGSEFAADLRSKREIRMGLRPERSAISLEEILRFLDFNEVRSWYGTYRNNGLPMGHTLSPAISRLSVGWREYKYLIKSEKFKTWRTEANQGYKGCRYVDDVCLQIIGLESDHSKIEEFKREYERAVKPLSVEWRDGDRRFLDCVYPLEGRQRRVFETSKIVPIVNEDLPSAMRDAVYTSELRRRNSRKSSARPHSGRSETTIYMERQGVPKARWKVIAARGKNPRKPPLDRSQTKWIHIAYTHFWERRIGRRILKVVKELWKLEDSEVQQKRKIFWDICSQKALFMLCAKVPKEDRTNRREKVEESSESEDPEEDPTYGLE